MFNVLVQAYKDITLNHEATVNSGEKPFENSSEQDTKA
jgi:hypothetical protein